MKIRVFEAFAGVGSQHMALKNLQKKYNFEFDVVGISDVDKWALISYSAIHHKDDIVDEKSESEMLNEIKKRNIGYNFSTGKSEIPKKYKDLKLLYESHIKSKNYGDIRLIDVEELPDFDLFTYSYPCKNVSVEGKKEGFSKGGDTQTSLVWECKKIIENKKPKYLMMENVKNIVSRVHIGSLNEWIEELDHMGYNSYLKVLNGVNFGVPQKRERAIMVSILKEHDDGFEMPQSNGKKTCLLDIIDDVADEKYYVDREKLENLIYNDRFDNGKFYVDVREANKKGFAEATRGDSINIMQQNSKTRRGRVGKQNANTITTACTQCVIDRDNRVRKLKPVEYWRLMGFSDDDFKKIENLIPETKQYERAGRGIVVPMLEAIFTEMFKIK